jgi:spore maturation protein CgeB
MKVYSFGDPENSQILAQPIAPAFDVHLVNQFSEIEKFRNWGLKRVHFWPLGSLSSEEETQGINEQSILKIAQREIPLVLFTARSPWRREQLDMLAQSFPDALIAGHGWDKGFVQWATMFRSYRNAKIGWNIHNTTGFNFRTYELPAYGVMQICDNKSDLGRIFRIGEEVVGFDNIDECVELTKYYLSNPEDQCKIALAGWKRWRKEYSPDRIWDKLVELVEGYWPEFAPERSYDQHVVLSVSSALQRHKRLSTFRNLYQPAVSYARKLWHILSRNLQKILT